MLPALRADLGLTYAQIGLLLGLPAVIGTLIEPLLMLLGDTGSRKRLVVGGGLAIALSLLLVASARSFPVVLLAFSMSYPASGAFVSLSQATLIDLNPGREPQGMARWSVAGSFGNLLGPLLVAGGFALALGWRWVYLDAGLVRSLINPGRLAASIPNPPGGANDNRSNQVRHAPGNPEQPVGSDAQSAAAALAGTVGAVQLVAGRVYGLCRPVPDRCGRFHPGAGQLGCRGR